VFEQASSPQYREGLTAGCAAELVACPYQPDTAEAAAWMAGVRAARL
jgi:ribosome modulation factor